MANKKSGNFSIRRLIYNDKYLIIFSLVLAVFVWIATSLSIGTDESKTISINVPITLADEVSTKLGMQYYSLKDNIDINVTIKGAKYVIGQVDENDLNIKFDTSGVSRTGEQTIPILVNNASKALDFDVESVYPSSIQGYFDVDETRTFDVDVFYDKDNVADGYILGEPILSEDKIQISGPKTYIDRVKGVSLQVNFGENVKISDLFKADCDIEIDGSNIESSYLTVTSRSDTETRLNTISVSIPVLKVMELPVSVDLEDIPPGIDANDIHIKYSQSTISAGVLESADLKSAVIGRINFNELKSGKNVFEFDVTSLQGITLLDKTLKTIKVDVTVKGNYKMQRVYPVSRDVLVEGLEDGYEANVVSLDKYSLSVLLPSDDSVKLSDIEIKCDVSERKEDNIYPLVITVKNNGKAWIYGTYHATVEIKAKG